MTTRPKARKFRIRRPAAAGAPAAAGDEPQGTGSAAAGSAAPGVTATSASANIAALRAALAGTRAAGGQQATQETGPAETEAEERTTGQTGTGQRDAARTAAAAGGARSSLSGVVESPAEVSAAEQIDAIRREGLTGRQLRMARRVAQRHGIAATSDFDAVRQLRARGIDPFQQSGMLELVVPSERRTEPAETAAPSERLPQTVPRHRPDDRLPSTEVSPAERRASEITRIQRDIARRRRRKLALLLTRLAFFVFLPTLLAGYYFYAIATPMYATKSEFLILKSDGGGGGAMGGLLSGTQFATNQDSIAVQSYLESKDAMVRLDEDEGFRDHFSQPWIDPIQRLEPDASTEDAYSLYSRNVQLGYDPTEGVIRMEVTAADAEVATRFSEALLTYAEERVDSLSQRKRENQVVGAEQALADAEAARREAQAALVTLQQEGAVLDPEGRIAALRSQINNIEMQIQEKQLELAALEDNLRPNAARLEGVRGDIRRLETLLGRVNAQMTEATTSQGSLAELASQIQLAQADVATRDLMLQSALESLEQARRDASSQTRYLTTSVRPLPPEDPSYPKAFENTVLAFLIFSGIYLMISLTASILREQVSS
ncbi:capsule biosynthesis protein [Rhodosalinus sp.]|uniref:capsule biosynthesis protein n=1 Tax=Rhodosalinus sp. TaxID=2047741 RepID=UPI00397BF1D2